MNEQIERDLKVALLSGDKRRVEVLKGIKTALQYETVSLNAKESGLSEEQIQKVLMRESKKRADAAELYKSVNEQDRAQNEVDEKVIIDSYLPKQVDESEIKSAVNEEVSKIDNPQLSDMGKVIGAVKAKFGASADGAAIAKLVKEALSA